mmetsp:Transcript_12113/g.24601  ORF Transcript_12113/g.24601 Transcript_12113/m.24601 type:complete len:265 (-) Transcript_12113:32-826(-)
MKKLKERLKRELKMKRQLHQMMPDAENNMKKLKEIIEEGRKRLRALEEEWVKHRDPMVASLEEQRRLQDEKQSAIDSKIAAIRSMKADIASMATEIRAKEALSISLKKSWDSMPKNINRAVYTRRILDIITQVSKQKAEIRRIIGDIREVQKDVNRVGATLARTETVADETIFRAAKDSKGGKSGASATKSYRNLSVLRESFEKLIVAVEAAGKADNDARELEGKTETLRARVDGQSVEILKRDLDEVRKENKEMIAELKAGKR